MFFYFIVEWCYCKCFGFAFLACADMSQLCQTWCHSRLDSECMDYDSFVHFMLLSMDWRQATGALARDTNQSCHQVLSQGMYITSARPGIP